MIIFYVADLICGFTIFTIIFVADAVHADSIHGRFSCCPQDVPEHWHSPSIQVFVNGILAHPFPANTPTPLQVNEKIKQKGRYDEREFLVFNVHCKVFTYNTKHSSNIHVDSWILIEHVNVPKVTQDVMIFFFSWVFVDLFSQ